MIVNWLVLYDHHNSIYSIAWGPWSDFYDWIYWTKKIRLPSCNCIQFRKFCEFLSFVCCCANWSCKTYHYVLLIIFYPYKKNNLLQLYIVSQLLKTDLFLYQSDPIFFHVMSYLYEDISWIIIIMVNIHYKL